MPPLFGSAQTHRCASATNETGTLHEPRTRTKYLYDALGHRTDKQTGSYHVSYLHDPSGNPVTEYCAPCTWGTGWNRGYVYMNGQQVAEYANGTTYFVHQTISAPPA